MFTNQINLFTRVALYKFDYNNNNNNNYYYYYDFQYQSSYVDN